MLSLAPDLRSVLETAIVHARDAAESAARAYLAPLEIKKDRLSRPLPPEMNQARKRLRAKARQLGGGKEEAGFDLLVEEIAYEQWHRMLFSRFLAENNLLIHPEHGVPVTLPECAELAKEMGQADAWQVAARFAGAMLPGIFKQDDPAANVRFAREHQLALEKILDNIPPRVFHSDNGLGWVYQFWQAKKKKEVNASERKIGGADIAPVTQLFTEDYMVRFLLENTLGAWWAARHPTSPLVREWKYLRWLDDGTPAAGTFEGWPPHAALIRFMDPCCGSGHFCVAAFDMLYQMRMEEEGLSAADAADAALRDNIFGLELDPRCTQIAAFALALASWKVGGYRMIPIPHIACSGIAVQGQLQEWTKLAGGDALLRTALERLYELFKHAPDLGSLINPADVPESEKMFTADYSRVEPLLEKALARSRKNDADDPVAAVFGAAAEETMSAAQLLAGKYTLVATNVPYLSRGKQGEILREFLGSQFPDGKTDLATAFVERCVCFLETGGTCAIVTPQNWLFQDAYKRLRVRLLKEVEWEFVCRLGTSAFDMISGWVVNIALLALSNTVPISNQLTLLVDASAGTTATEKAILATTSSPSYVHQHSQVLNPDSRIVFGEVKKGELLEKYATAYQGLKTGDDSRLTRFFWEVPIPTKRWRFFQSTVESSVSFGGLERIIDWASDGQNMARLQGISAWKKVGVAISQMGNLPCALYTGEIFDSNMSPIVLRNARDLTAVWAFCNSPEFASSVRAIDHALKVANSSLVKVPFDLEYWQRVADEMGPLPEPYSNDPTQWLFEGHPVGSTEPLQVAVARLLGYKWPPQKRDNLDKHADADGIVCLPPIAGEQPAAERLRALLADAFGDAWSPAESERLLASVGFAGRTLDAWLRDGFFEQHCRLFHNRPFIWHIWDGRKDGFAALVNYHKLDGAKLERLIYTYLGDWIEKQKSDVTSGVAGADGRLVAALQLQEKLKLIRLGEPPYDIYVRWKPLAQQPIGWEPDLNDGVRLNIRPFVTAGVLHSRFTINWNKDRGKNRDGSDRLNDLHYAREAKAEARNKK